MKIAICDDEKLFRMDLKNRVEHYLAQKAITPEIDLYTSGESILAASKIREYDLIFLDVSMKELNGIETGRIISRKNPSVIIVFVSGLIEYSPQSLEVDSTIRYLLKDKLDDTFPECMKAIFRKLNVLSQRVEFTFIDGPLIFYQHEILYLESSKHTVTFHFASTKKMCQRIKDSLDNIESRLNDGLFVRIHKSFLVNMAYINIIRGYDCILSTDDILPVSQRKKSPAVRKLFEYKSSL